MPTLDDSHFIRRTQKTKPLFNLSRIGSNIPYVAEAVFLSFLMFFSEGADSFKAGINRQNVHRNFMQLRQLTYKNLHLHLLPV